MEYSEKDFLSLISEIIEEETFGKMYTEVSPSSYDDRIPADTLAKTFEAVSAEADKYPTAAAAAWEIEGRLHELIDYWDAGEAYETAYILEQADRAASLKGEEFHEAYTAYANGFIAEASAAELLSEAGWEGCSYDAAEWLDMPYRLNILFATKNETNWDTSSIPYTFQHLADFPDNCFNGTWQEGADNALTVLVAQQGHSISEIADVIYRPDKAAEAGAFANSVGSEIQNLYSGTATVTALVTARGRDLLDLLGELVTKKSSIELPTHTVVGLYDSLGGGGSNLDIQLEKPAVLPCSLIWKTQIETGGRSAERWDYTVDDTYGLVGECWNATPTITNDAGGAYVIDTIEECAQKLAGWSLAARMRDMAPEELVEETGYSEKQAAEIRSGLEHGLSSPEIAAYAKPDITATDMRNIRMKLESGASIEETVAPRSPEPQSLAKRAAGAREAADAMAAGHGSQAPKHENER